MKRTFEDDGSVNTSPARRIRQDNPEPPIMSVGNYIIFKKDIFDAGMRRINEINIRNHMLRNELSNSYDEMEKLENDFNTLYENHEEMSKEYEEYIEYSKKLEEQNLYFRNTIDKMINQIKESNQIMVNSQPDEKTNITNDI